MNLDLTRQFLSRVWNSESYICKCIQILPDEIVNGSVELQNIIESGKSQIVSQNDCYSGMQQIVLSKSTFSMIFLECYKYIHQNTSGALVLKEPDELRVATFGLLLVTALDSTALMVNYDVLIRLEFPDHIVWENYVLIGGYLTSNYERTNKASCLWTYFKRLHISLLQKVSIRDFEINDNVDFDVFKSITMDNSSMFQKYELLNMYTIWVCLKSISVHPRNYYACNSLSFFLANLDNFQIRKKITWLVYKWIIEQEMHDLSLWTVLLNTLIDLKSNNLNYYRNEFERYSTDMKISDSTCCSDNPGEEQIDSFLSEIFYSMKNWCFGIGCNCYSGILTLFNLQSHVGCSETFAREMEDYITTFEKKYKMFVDVSGESLIDANGSKVELESDLLLRDKFQLVLNIKRILKEKITNNK